MAAVVGSRRIEGAGTPEADWHSWAGLHAVPPLSLDQTLPAAQRLVVVAPHPDDEVLACGGLLHLHAARGGTVLVASVTDGEASHADSAPCSADRMALRRRIESASGLAHLSAGATIVRFGIPDGKVGLYTSALVTALSRVLNPLDTVVSTWRLDGHPDHEATGIAAALACQGVGCRLLEAPVWMWHWAAPGDTRVPWHRMHGLEIPTDAVLRKRQALEHHATQLEPRSGDLGPVLGSSIVERTSRRFEYFFR